MRGRTSTTTLMGHGPHQDARAIMLIELMIVVVVLGIMLAAGTVVHVQLLKASAAMTRHANALVDLGRMRALLASQVAGCEQIGLGPLSESHRGAGPASLRLSLSTPDGAVFTWYPGPDEEGAAFREAQDAEDVEVLHDGRVEFQAVESEGRVVGVIVSVLSDEAGHARTRWGLWASFSVFREIP